LYPRRLTSKHERADLLSIDSYAAFSLGGAEGAMRSIDHSIVWTVRATTP
jgi:hypothetical protein